MSSPEDPPPEPRAGVSDASGASGPGPESSPAKASGREKPTIRAVAERARVAVSTVSRVLNGGYASAAARARVQGAIQELGFAPSVTAQSLVTGRAGCIGVASYVTRTSFFSQILAGVEEQLADSRQSVLLASLVLRGRYDSSTLAAWIRERRVDGLVLIRYTRREADLLEAARAAGLPVVLVGPDLKAPATCIVRCDNLEAGRVVGEHLMGLGHRRIAFAGGPNESIDTRDRLRGLTEALAERQLELPESRVWCAPNFWPESGVAFAQQFLSRPRAERATAVVLGSDSMALAFMRTVLQQGLQIPRDVSVVGFDGIPEGELYWPGLTTLAQPAQRMGASGCRALLEYLKDPSGQRDADVQYGVELIVRESTGRPPD